MPTKRGKPGIAGFPLHTFQRNDAGSYSISKPYLCRLWQVLLEVPLCTPASRLPRLLNIIFDLDMELFDLLQAFAAGAHTPDHQRDNRQEEQHGHRGKDTGKAIACVNHRDEKLRTRHR